MLSYSCKQCQQLLQCCTITAHLAAQLQHQQPCLLLNMPFA
jgi:hypothetical protein